MKTAAPQRTLWLAAGGVLALACTLWAGICLAGWTVGSVEKTEHHVLRGDVEEVRIDGSFSDVTLLPASGDEVVVDSRAKGSLWLPEMETRIDGNQVTVRGSCHVAVFGSCSASFVVRVPQGVAVNVTSGAGDVRAHGLSAPVSLDVSSGDVSLAELTGGTTAKVSSGDIDAARLGGRVVLESRSGDIGAADLTAGVVSARASSGDVFVDFAATPERVNAAASSGDVTIAVPRNGADYDAQASASSGDADVGVDHNSAASRSLTAITSSGDATIRYR